MNSRSNNKTGSINAFDFDLGLDSGGAKPMNDQKKQTSSYSSTTYTYSAAQQKPGTTSSWSHQPKPAWTHQPAPPVQTGMAGSLSGPASMVGDIFGKSWNSSASSSSGVSGVGIVNNKNPNLFGDLLGSAIGQNKSSNNVPLKKTTPIASQNTFSMGNVADSLPKTGYSGTNTASWASSVSNGGANVNIGGNYTRSSSVGSGNLGGNSNRNPNLGGPSLTSMSASGVGGSAMGSGKDPFGSLVDFASKPSAGMNPASKTSDKSGSSDDLFGDFQSTTTSKPSGSSFSSSAFPTSNTDPLTNFGFTNTPSNNQSQPPKQPSGANDFDVLFSSTGGGGNEGFTSQQFSEGDDWGINSEFGGGDHDTGGTTEIEGLPPPPAGVSAPSAKSKGMDNYKQGQFADAIKWLSWAVILLEKAGDDDGTMEVLTCRASCYKEVGEYKKAVADCTKVRVFRLTLRMCIILNAQFMLYDEASISSRADTMV